MLCVCGDPESSHRPIVLSVPLTNEKPLYKLPTVLYGNVASTRPNATYDAVQYHCGCTTFTPDDHTTDYGR